MDMQNTAKDPLSEVASALNEGQSSQPPNAAGAEIPVTVHASRYSAASKGAGKLPPVHEETRTVIIFPQGAVVRLSATVTPGELVVLTNKRTGADVICRVMSVKTQPGIQNYVHLEFTQRALDYWEEAPATERGIGSKPQPIADTSAPPAPTPIDSAHRTPSPSLQVAPPLKPSVLAAEVKSPAAPLPQVTPLADAPTTVFEKASGDAEPVQASVPEINAAAVLVQKQPRIMPSRTPRLQSFEPALQQDKNGSKAIILFAIASVVLLAIGAVGGAIFLRRDRGTSIAQQVPSAVQPANPAPVAVPSQPEQPTLNASARTNSPEAAANSPVKGSAVETPAHPMPIRTAIEQPKALVEAPKAEVQPQPVPVSRPAINVGKISAPNVKAAQLNSSAPPPVLPTEGNALPSIITEATAHGSALAPAQPAPPPPTKGGQLQQPKLLASVAAVYPPLARAQHVQGDVVIDALIDATGKVTATKVMTGNPLLQSAAVDSLRLWKYQPARLNGEPIPIHINVAITFHLQ
jgi:periplasmic protein TonB